MPSDVAQQTKQHPFEDSLELVQSGRPFFDRLVQLIGQAVAEIHIQTYILNDDSTGQEIADALKAAAARGIRIYVLADAFGSNQMSSQFLRELRKAGIRIRRFGRILSGNSFHIGRRLHRKVVVIDGWTSIVGGINLGNNYNEFGGKPAWLDFAVIVRGKTSRDLQRICRGRWRTTRFPKLNLSREILPPPDPNAFYPVEISIRRNDFLRNRNEIALTYRKAIRRSRKSLIIVGGYFLPGGYTRRLLRRATERGVSISVVVPERSDVKIMVAAQHFLYNWMLRNGIQIYEYRPSNVHGKIMISDQEFVTIGSYDLNNLSTFSNIELNLDIQDRHFALHFTGILNRIMREECELVTSDKRQRRISLVRRFKYWLSYRLVKTLFYLSWFLGNKKDQEF